MRGTEPSDLAVRTSAAPDDLVAELLRPEDRVEGDLQVVTGGGVAVQVQRTRRLEHAVELDEPRGHRDHVRGHRALLEEGPDGGESLSGELGEAALVDEELVRLTGLVAPRPSVSNAWICAAASPAEAKPTL